MDKVLYDGEKEKAKGKMPYIYYLQSSVLSNSQFVFTTLESHKRPTYNYGNIHNSFTWQPTTGSLTVHAHIRHPGNQNKQGTVGTMSSVSTTG